MSATVSPSVPAWNGSPKQNALYAASESSPPRTLPIGEAYGFLIVSVNDDGSETYEGLICGHDSDPFKDFTWDAQNAAEKCLAEGFVDGTTKPEIWRAYEIASITLTGRRMLEDGDPLLKPVRKKSTKRISAATTTDAASVVIVPKPDDWQPAHPLDVPPHVERIAEDCPNAFAHSFNEAEMENGKGQWAVPLALIPTSNPSAATAVVESLAPHLARIEVATQELNAIIEANGQALTIAEAS